MDITDAFRGSAAVATGALSRGVLRGPRYRRLYPDVYLPAELPADLAARSRAAYLLVEPRGVLSGYSAAELLGARCGPAGAPAEVTCPWPRHPLPGLLVHRTALAADEIVTVVGLRVTSPARTAFDLGRWLGPAEAVAAVDALAHRFPFELEELRTLYRRHLGAPGGRRLLSALHLVDRRAEAPAQSWARVALVLAGLPPAVQVPVRVNGCSVRLQLAYPAVRLAVELCGRQQRTPARARRDRHRQALLAATGWTVRRFDAWTVRHRPQQMVARTRAELLRRGGCPGAARVNRATACG